MISSSSQSRTPNPRSNPIPPARDISTGSSIRPRNKRLNTLDGQDQELLSATSGRSTPTIESRAASPIPATHLSRTAGRAEGLGSSRSVGGFVAAPGVGSRNGAGIGIRSDNSNASGGIWYMSWMSSAIQQVANSVLGGIAGDEAPSNGQGKGKRKPNYGTRQKIPVQWGPTEPPDKLTPGEIGIGSTAEREAAVRAKKTKRILEGLEEERVPDTNGNYKRRTSLDEQRPSSPKDNLEALVYVHHVQKNDTFAGIVLKYNCAKEVFRKANGLWSNDGIQFRKTVVLPVDACTVKGRPCDAPSVDSPFQGVDLLAPTPGIEDSPFSANGNAWPPTPSSHRTSAVPLQDNERTHVRWVLIDSSPNSKPVQIARMSRKTLGYFPPRRRKSQNAHSVVSTPKGSLDSHRISTLSQSSTDPTGSPGSSHSRRTSSLGLHPSQLSGSIGSYFPPASIVASTRARRESVSEAAGRLNWMQGPGGVGTFGKNVRKPGPGNDGLNAWAKKHIPGLAIDSLPSTSVMGAETAHFGFSDELAAIAEGPINGGTINGILTPGATQGIGLENAAAAVEGFFRKMVTKGPGTPRLGAGAEPDLIELLDGAGSDDGRGFELSPRRLRSETPLGTGREDLDGVIRGRASAGTKGGKSD